MSVPATQNYDHLFKLLLVGDAAVGKSCLLMRFTSASFEEDSASTIGVDFKIKFLKLGNEKLKLTIWDTAGQERFRTLTSSYYRGAHGIIFVYDVTRRETFDNLAACWLDEVEMYGTVQDAAKMVVGNKVDLEKTREVTQDEGISFARENGCLFVETSAKADTAVSRAFEELACKIMDTPALVAEGQAGTKLGLNDSQRKESSGMCC